MPAEFSPLSLEHIFPDCDSCDHSALSVWRCGWKIPIDRHTVQVRYCGRSLHHASLNLRPIGLIRKYDGVRPFVFSPRMSRLKTDRVRIVFETIAEDEYMITRMYFVLMQKAEYSGSDCAVLLLTRFTCEFEANLVQLLLIRPCGSARWNNDRPENVERWTRTDTMKQNLDLVPLLAHFFNATRI